MFNRKKRQIERLTLERDALIDNVLIILMVDGTRQGIVPSPADFWGAVSPITELDKAWGYLRYIMDAIGVIPGQKLTGSYEVLRDEGEIAYWKPPKN